MCHGLIEDATDMIADDKFHIRIKTFLKFYNLLKEVCPPVTVQDLEQKLKKDIYQHRWGGVLFTFDEAYLGVMDIIPMLVGDKFGVILFCVQSATEEGFFLPTAISRVTNSMRREKVLDLLDLPKGSSDHEVISKLQLIRQTSNFDFLKILNNQGISKKDRVMNKQELRHMSSLGVVIGSHTLSHPDLCAISKKELHSELALSRDYFKSVIGKDIRWFSYPGGSFNSQVIKAVRETGYEFAVTAVPPGFIKTTNQSNQFLELPRVDIYGEADNPFFSLARLCGLEALFRRKFYG
jgi:hypothetical protein